MKHYLSVCSGIEAASVAWKPLGWKPVGFSEIEPFPCSVLNHRFPDVKNFGDMTKYKEWGIDSGTVDLLVGGTPCFPGDVLIVTKRGLIPIKSVVVGDEVFTHCNRWKTVLATGSTLSNTTLVKGQGQSSGIETTHEHPFLSKTKSREWIGRSNGCYKSIMSQEEWTPAKNMAGLMWASPSVWPKSEQPPIIPFGREKDFPKISEKIAWIIGRWLGDGWCRINSRRGYVIICCGKHESDFLESKIQETGIHYSKNYERTTIRFQIANRAFARWLTDNFGEGCYNKTIPTWVFGWEFRSALLDGYISADGCVCSGGRKITTVSKSLALGSVLLSHSLGLSASRRLVNTGRTNPVIEGRLVTEKPFWQITIYNNSRSSIDDGVHRWGLVRRVCETGKVKKVFNLEVEGDNSYVADGICVHNCQSFSVAGLRRGLEDPRGNLMLVYGAIADYYKPSWIVWENVPGVLSSGGGGRLQNLPRYVGRTRVWVCLQGA